MVAYNDRVCNVVRRGRFEWFQVGKERLEVCTSEFLSGLYVQM